MAGKKILIVEDEFIVANDLRIMLIKSGYEVCGIAASVDQASALVTSKKPDWVLLDIILKGKETGTDLAHQLNELKIPFLYISANTNQEVMERVKQTRPYGFMVKPFREKDLLVMLDVARHRFEVEQQTSQLQSQVKLVPGAIKGVIGHSSALMDVVKKVALVAPTATSVLICGESGTGKERIAHAIHELSHQKTRPFVTINCGALPASLIESELFGHEKGSFTGALNKREGKFEQANGGTIFLDEIGELPLESQVKLLRVLQEKEIERIGSSQTLKIEVRVIAATNKNLEKEVAEGRFRLDLYYRLNVFPILLPPLRQREDDIEELVDYFIQTYNHKLYKKVKGFSSTALAKIKAYHWPGNIRELEHFIERHILLSQDSIIQTVELPELENNIAVINSPAPEMMTLETVERNHIMYALKSCGGKVSGKGGAAEMLNIPASTLYLKIKKLGIKQGYFG